MNILDAKKRAEITRLLEADKSYASIERETGCNYRTITAIESELLAAGRLTKAIAKKSRHVTPLFFRGRIGRCTCGAKAILIDNGFCRACVVRSQTPHRSKHLAAV